MKRRCVRQSSLERRPDSHFLRRKKWRNLVDTFKNGQIKYTISLTHIQTVFSAFKINL